MKETIKMVKKTIPDMHIRIVKMVESSGNIQFFVQLHSDISQENLSYSSHETKHKSKLDCMSDAYFMASMVAKFIRTPMENVDFIHCDQNEIDYMKKQTCLKWR